MKFRVVLTENAEQDVENILQWFVEQSAASAGERWFQQLMARIATLESHPERCPLAPESSALGVEIREILFGKRRGRYRLFFQIDGRTVLLLRVWHGARNAPSLGELM